MQFPVPPLQQRTPLSALQQVLPHVKVVLSGGGKSSENTASTARCSDYRGGDGFGDCGVGGAGSGDNVVEGLSRQFPVPGPRFLQGTAWGPAFAN